MSITQPLQGPKVISVRMQSPDDAVAPFSAATAGSSDKIYEYANKKPVWSDQVDAYVLNFDGRVTVASTKNLILMSPHESVQSCAGDGSEVDGETHAVALRFGRVAKKSPDQGLSQFSLDVAHPMSPLQAAGVAMSSLLSNVDTCWF